MTVNFELEDDLWWKTEVNLPSWRGFQSMNGPYGAKDSDIPSNGNVTIIFAPEGRDIEPLSNEEIKSVVWVVENEEPLAKYLLSSLVNVYPSLQKNYGYTEQEKIEFMPNVNTQDDFRNLIGLHSVNVHPLKKDGIPYVGFEFGCTWDSEHGLGVLMHGNRVVEIGEADTAIYLWIAEEDAKNP
ncbi:MAG: hypothetical protein WBC60_01405 [Cognaticolwellia sp.]